MNKERTRVVEYSSSRFHAGIIADLFSAFSRARAAEESRKLRKYTRLCERDRLRARYSREDRITHARVIRIFSVGESPLSSVPDESPIPNRSTRVTPPD